MASEVSGIASSGSCIVESRFGGLDGLSATKGSTGGALGTWLIAIVPA